MFPAHAGMDRQVRREVVRRRPCSPRTRGWTVPVKDLFDACYVFPAHAGMDRSSISRSQRGFTCSPRTRGWTGRGDVGGLRRRCVPRARGDGPAHRFGQTVNVGRVPRARGDGPSEPWPTTSPMLVFPAHAGMDRLQDFRFRQSLRVPRARGDGPMGTSAGRRAAIVFPAHAGMDRRTASRSGGCCSCSPRTRGWTDRGCASPRVRQSVPRARGDGPIDHVPPTSDARVFPAHAGMDR